MQDGILMSGDFKERLKKASFGLLIVAIAVAGPVVAYAGVNVVWPESPHTFNVNANPPIQFLEGTDYQTAKNLSYISPWPFSGANSNASFSIIISGLSGGNVTIDDYVNVTKNSGVTSYKMQMSTALSGTLSPAPTTLKLRAWTGGTPPVGDGSAGVCGTLNLLSGAGTETSGGPCTNSGKLQIEIVYGANSTGSSSLNLRPSSIVYA